jgi:pantetheine-phosphate adenylyltransferase
MRNAVLPQGRTAVLPYCRTAVLPQGRHASHYPATIAIVAVSHRSVAVFAGSFDPLHMGHADIVTRATQIFPKVVVGVLNNPGKEALFTPAERVEMLRELYKDDPAVEAHAFTGLLVNFLKEMGATILIRGMRAVSDFEYEFQMALMNRHLWPQAETVFLTPKGRYTYLSSRLVREVAALGGDISGLVPDSIKNRMMDRIDLSTQNPPVDG